IPSKALLQSSEYFEYTKGHLASHGIKLKGASLDIDTFLGRKDTVVSQNNDGILYLFKKNKVTFFHGQGKLNASVDGGWSIEVSGQTNESLVARHVIIATVSVLRALPGLKFDVERILSDARALRIQSALHKLGC